MSSAQVLSAGIVVRNEEGKVMLMQRQYFKGGKAVVLGWELPKGRVEKGETKEQAAVREVEEETGLKGLTPEDLTLLDQTTYTMQRNGEKVAKTVVFYHAVVKGEPVFDLEMRERGTHAVSWFTRDEIKRLPHRNGTLLAMCKASFEGFP
eukprot:TRINITY_DN47173_c0_g1_i1.p1 TRINITY_DN47173_c0_g1~~TRINITY_DN47173_c0_g1_i1.p1  ORF type:complete len:166 (+),score=51.35 TRINITY_DN47173_c0_g1_i1:49-498(+)